jgi:crossover junction endodeoxyribonuclease RuvC
VAFFIAGETALMKAMGIDAGLAQTGFGVVEILPRGGKACEWGTIRTEADCPISLRLKTIYDELRMLFEEWKPDLLVLEDVFVLRQYPKAAIQLGEVRCHLRGAREEYYGASGEADGGEECPYRKRSGR